LRAFTRGNLRTKRFTSNLCWTKLLQRGRLGDLVALGSGFGRSTGSCFGRNNTKGGGTTTHVVSATKNGWVEHWSGQPRSSSASRVFSCSISALSCSQSCYRGRLTVCVRHLLCHDCTSPSLPKMSPTTSRCLSQHRYGRHAGVNRICCCHCHPEDLCYATTYRSTHPSHAIPQCFHSDTPLCAATPTLFFSIASTARWSRSGVALSMPLAHPIARSFAVTVAVTVAAPVVIVMISLADA